MSQNPPEPHHESPADDSSVFGSALQLLFALLVALGLSVIAGFLAVYHDGNILGRPTGTHTYAMPLVVGIMFGFVVLMSAVLRRRACSASTMALILALMVVAAPLGRHVAEGFVGTVGFTASFMERRQAPGPLLESTDITKVLPPQALLEVEGSREFDFTLESLEPNEWASVTEVPWSLWGDPLFYWGPLMLLVLGIGISLGLVVYRQWSENELVSFPLARCFSSLVTRDEGRPWPDVFYRPTFWFGFGLMIFIFTTNGLNAHFEKMIEIPVKFNYYALSQTFPFLANSHEGYSVLRATFYFTMIAIAVLLPMEISFTAWVIWPVMILGSYFYYLQTGLRYGGSENTALLTGAWLAMSLLLLWTGRHYFGSLLRAAIGFRAASADHLGTWAMRGLVLCTLGLIAALTVYGLPLDLAAFWVLVLLLGMLVLSRLVAEMGLIWTPLGFVAPTNIISLVMGPALGAKMIALLAWMGQILTYQAATYMPVAPAVVLAADVDTRAGGRGRLALMALPMVLLSLAAMMLVVVMIGYSHEGRADFSPDLRHVNNAANRLRQNFPTEVQAGTWMDAPVPGALERWTNMQPPSSFVSFFIFGFLLVTLTGLMRLRLPRFPLHPLPMMLIGTWLMSRYWWAFLFGWLIKKMLIKVGGVRLFEILRPVCYGVIVGQAVIITFWMIVNVILFTMNERIFDAAHALFMYDFF